MLSKTLKPAREMDAGELLLEIFDATNIRHLRYHNWRWYRSVMEYKPYDFLGAPVKLIELWSHLVKMIHVAEKLLHEAPAAFTALPHPLSAMEKTAADFAFMKGLFTLYDLYNGQVLHLFTAEADQPLLFFRRFFESRSKEAWHQLLDEWLEYGLDKTGMGEYCDTTDEMPEALELLQGLCEACWLLHEKQKAVVRLDTQHCQELSAGEAGTKQFDEDSIVDKLATVFEETEIEYLHFDLWQWFRSLFLRQPYNFRGDPSMVLHLRRHLSHFIAAAAACLQEPGLRIDALDHSFTDRQRYYAFGKLHKQYGGCVTRLSAAETQQPVLFFRRFFRFKNQDAWEFVLNDWMEDALSRGAFTERIYVEELADSLELLEGLCEACWLLYRGRGEEVDIVDRVDRVDIVDKVARVEEVEKGEVTIPVCQDSSNRVEEEELAAIIEKICASMDAEKIFLLGKYPLKPAGLGEEYDLLVLVKNADNRPMDELESFVRNRSEELAPVHATVMKMSKVNELLKAGNWYFSNCCTAGNLVYDAGSMPLTQTDEAFAPSLAEMETAHRGLLAKANSFLEGARLYQNGGEYALAAFMLHQAMEHGINAILVPLMQFRMKTHSLHKLLRFLRRFSTGLYDIFPRDTEKELTMFQLLQRAYVHARYKDNYVVSAGDSEALTNRVSFFLARVALVFSTIKTNGKDG